ncbi:hypothetical protein EHS89_05460 [Amphritea balenae]|uniref:Uncharacterized protein n=2 Tax=Amphritea balenae TaxID=452629 RepID=A0A3P1SU80_9GAMM|nr:hypothetical protein EHS89_05460 [Amphritea balenae]
MKIPLVVFNLLLLLLLLASSVSAGEADIIEVKARKAGPNQYDFSVTVSHTDDGWDHYVDKWDVLDLHGNLLGTRVLHHPHVNEQPFTRSLSGVSVPSGSQSVILRAHDSVHGYGGQEFITDLQDR